MRASVAKDNRSGNRNISWVWAHPPVCHRHYCLANRALDGNKVFTFPFGSGWWIIPAIDIISANKESCLGLASQGFQGNESCWCLRSSLCSWPRVKRMEWLIHSHMPCSDERTDPPSSASGTSPGSHLTKPHRWCLVQGSNFGSHHKARKEGSYKSRAFPCPGQDQDVSLFLFLHAVTSARVTMVGRAAAVTTQAGLYGHL